MQNGRFRLTPLALGLGVLAGAGALEAAPLTLSDERFHVEATWRTADGQTGSGTPVRLTRETGYFWFFSPTNTEVVVKMLDACSGPAPRFWVFAGGLTDTEVTLTVTDQANGEKKVYRNPRGTPFAPIQDTGAFATCAVAHCGEGSFADLAASPRANRDLEALAMIMSGTIVAPQAVYDRVVADVAAITAQNPNLAVPFALDFDPRRLILTFDEATAPQVAGGTYLAWACLNRRFGLEDVELLFQGQIAFLRFDKVLDATRLGPHYQALPGVRAAEPDSIILFPGAPLPASYCGRRGGELHKYYIRLADNSIHFYSSLPGAPPALVGSTLGNPNPWLDDALACFQEHVIQ